MPLVSRRLAAAALGALLLTQGAASFGQDFPSRPIRVLVPLAAGSTADIIARAVGNELAKGLGQPLVIDNKPGAGGSIAMAEVAHAAPDGYTISLASQGNLVFNLALYSQPGYDTTKDFAMLGLVGGVSNVMVVAPGAKATTVAAFIEEARARPGAMTYSSGGNGTSHHLSGVLFSRLTDTKLLHVPYKGAPQGVLSVMSAETDVGFYNTPSVISQIKSGKLKALAVTSLSRSSLLPDVPTVDSTVKGYEINTWFGFVAPAGTPQPVLNRLQAAVKTAMESSALRAQLAEQGVDLAQDTSGKAMAKTVESDLAKWPALIKASGAKID